MTQPEHLKSEPAGGEDFDGLCERAASGKLLPRLKELIRGCPFYKNTMQDDAKAFAEVMLNRLAPPEDPEELLSALDASLTSPTQATFLKAAAAFENAAAATARLAQVDAIRYYLYASLCGCRTSVSKVAAYGAQIAYSDGLAHGSVRDHVTTAVAWLLAASGQMHLPATWTRENSRQFFATADREAARPGAERKLSGKQAALLVATACSNPPEGRKRWTLDLLTDAMVRLTEHEDLSRETVRRRLAEDDLKPWRRDMWCIPRVDGAYVARMEDVLDLYAEEADPKRPVVCFDESPTQLIGEVREPIPAEPGQPERYDCEYRRNGTANLFVFLDAHKPWRHVKVTQQRTAQDFAVCMRDLADIHYPDAERIRVVLDNLSTHTAGALYETFPAPEAHRILHRLEFHYTPKHASWLNMVEIEIGVLRHQCLDRRIGERDVLVSEIEAWQRQRNASSARIKWRFTTERARTKLARAYPDVAKESKSL